MSLAHREDLPPHAKRQMRRVVAWLMLWDDVPKSQIADRLDVSDQLVYKWIGQWRVQVGDDNLFRAHDPRRSEAMQEARDSRSRELAAERDRLGIELVSTARTLNSHLLLAVEGEDARAALTALHDAYRQAEENGDQLMAKQLKAQITRALSSGGPDGIKSLATALGIVTDKVIKMAAEANPNQDGSGAILWTPADEEKYTAAVERHGGSTNESQETDSLS